MPTILLRFPGGRYHATPWGDHVNEGAIEWPPSPWRLLRAFISVGYTKLGWRGLPETARTLFEALARVLPTFRLPPAVATHTRHYMPIGGLRGDGIEKTTMVFDAWAHVGDGELAIQWSVDLDGAERDLLAELVEKLGYVGRAESWVSGRLSSEADAVAAGTEATPCDGAPRGPGWEQVAVLAAETPDAYAAWRAVRASDAASATAGGARKAGKGKGKNKLPSADAGPEDLLTCLQVDTATLQAQGWTQPPGSRRVLYWRRSDALEAAAPGLVTTRRAARPVQMMLLALATPSGNAHALPSVTRTLPQAELLHAAFAKQLGDDDSPSLIGKAAGGAPLEGHRHAHVLPLDLDDDHRIDHVLIWAPMGLDAAAQTAVRAVRRAYTKRRDGDELRVAIAGLGEVQELVGVAQRAGGLAATSPGADAWVSATPFVPPRHLHARGKDTLEGQLQAELASRGLPVAAEIEVLDPRADEGQQGLRFRHFVLGRDKSRRLGPPAYLGVALRLRLSSRIAGPLCLGYASHFGLGRFRPA
jgi:CRISPR-associated protein Csb2